MPVGARAEHGPRLEDRDVGAVVRDVVASGIEQRAEQRGPQHRLCLRQRVLEVHHAPHLVLARQAQAVCERGVGEAPAGYLVQSAARERILRRAAHALVMGESAGRPATRGQRRGQAVHAVNACDLLDEVDLARDVVAPQRGHGDAQPLGLGLRLEVQRAEDRGLALARDGHAENPAHACLAQQERARRCRCPGEVDRPGGELGPGTALQQLGGSGLRVHALLRLQAFLEARRGLAAQPEHGRGAMDVGAAPGRHLEQHAGGTGLDLGAFTAHHAGD